MVPNGPLAIASQVGDRLFLGSLELLVMEKAVGTFGRRVKHAEGFLREGHELLSKLRAANAALVVNDV
jgi:hypothetical protein